MLKPLLLGLLVLVTGCQKQSEASKTGLIYCAEGSPLSFNPHVSNSGVTLDASARPLYDRLLEVNPNTLTLEPALASKWQISEDGLTYTLTLRQGVTFHQTPWFTPTRTLNAEDVVFTYARQLDLLHPYHQVSGGDYPYFYSLGQDQLIKRVYAKDPQTVVFELNQPNASFLATLASDYAVILSAEYADQMLKAGTPALLDSRPVGTGPFRFKEYRHNEFIRYLRHPGYWGGEARIEQLVYDITPRSSKRLAKLLTGECDVMSTPVASQLSVIKQHPDLNLSVQSGMNVAFLALNTRKPPFNDIKVRQAIASAINVDNLLQAVYFDTGLPANSLLPPLSWGYNPSLPQRKQDLKRARLLLKQAGLEQGFEMQVLVQPDARPYNPDAIKTAQLMRNDLARVGIRLKIVQQAWPVIERRLMKGQYDSLLSGWIADNADPDNFFRQLLSCSAVERGNNYSRWCNPAFDQLLDDAVTTPQLAFRLRNYYYAQTLLNEQLPLIPLAHALRTQISRSDIEGLQLMPFGGTVFNQAYRE
ncbi:MULTISPECIES: ABC transporter substrate-binding protein SapA [Aeromonas]|uniref:ABC transporter substrate-binding protein SapA n=2 Tax=Aeromonas TaxID=642 RepID=A0A175VKH1_AEREN|nr:ABC transporter substrate-binding protein SapA [Aeromonas enteropelogenes]KXU81215.1 peptide ABC transporter substrate-binding protein [Aeromonas enteropelogenes]BEE17384.1 ABC transporter substrate-binding protein [Aeromonas enteropelogenes]BEE21548.1 ABC transporter substrate-binding protein [Aeromonas enteropelogenes]